jgi:hypothetical protein
VAKKEELGITQTATAGVTINVRRNQNPPVFTFDVYSGQIYEKADLGSNRELQLDNPILATDADNVNFLYLSLFLLFTHSLFYRIQLWLIIKIDIFDEHLINLCCCQTVYEISLTTF